MEEIAVGTVARIVAIRKLQSHTVEHVRQGICDVVEGKFPACVTPRL